MFNIAKDFYKSIGLADPLRTDFEKNSYLKQMDGYNTECEASAWDFYSEETTVIKDDFR